MISCIVWITKCCNIGILEINYAYKNYRFPDEVTFVKIPNINGIQQTNTFKLKSCKVLYIRDLTNYDGILGVNNGWNIFDMKLMQRDLQTREIEVYYSGYKYIRGTPMTAMDLIKLDRAILSNIYPKDKLHMVEGNQYIYI